MSRVQCATKVKERADVTCLGELRYSDHTFNLRTGHPLIFELAALASVEADKRR